MTTSVLLKRLENHARGYAMADTSLNHIKRNRMTNETPNRPRQSRIAVVPILETLRTRTDTLCFQLRYYFLPQCVKLRSKFAWPGDAELVMKPTFPLFIGLVLVLKATPLATVRKGILDPSPSLQWMGHQIRRDKHWLF
jgi:hypothetical protein